jgi:hypothetical protein
VNFYWNTERDRIVGVVLFLLLMASPVFFLAWKASAAVPASEPDCAALALGDMKIAWRVSDAHGHVDRASLGSAIGELEERIGTGDPCDEQSQTVIVQAVAVSAAEYESILAGDPYTDCCSEDK